MTQQSYVDRIKLSEWEFVGGKGAVYGWGEQAALIWRWVGGWVTVS